MNITSIGSCSGQPHSPSLKCQQSSRMVGEPDGRVVGLTDGDPEGAVVGIQESQGWRGKLVRH